MENNWEVFKQKKIENLEQKLEIFIDKLEKIRSNRIVLEMIEKEINLKLTGERKPAKPVASLTISPNYELVVSNFEPKKSSLITDTILKLGYDKLGEKSSKEKLYFVLSIVTKEKKNEHIQEVKRITEKEKENFRLIRQDLRKWLKSEKNLSQDLKKTYEKQVDKLDEDYQAKLIEAEKKKIRELSS